MTDRFVEPSVAAERFQRLKVVVDRSALAKHEARVGRVEEVLVEGPSKKDAGVLAGRTRQNKLVHFAPPAGARVGAGDDVDVRIVAAAPPWLRGECVARHGGAGRARTRIPVTVV